MVRDAECVFSVVSEWGHFFANNDLSFFVPLFRFVFFNVLTEQTVSSFQLWHRGPTEAWWLFVWHASQLRPDTARKRPFSRETCFANGEDWEWIPNAVKRFVGSIAFVEAFRPFVVRCAWTVRGVGEGCPTAINPHGWKTSVVVGHQFHVRSFFFVTICLAACLFTSQDLLWDKRCYSNRLPFFNLVVSGITFDALLSTSVRCWPMNVWRVVTLCVCLH